MRELKYALSAFCSIALLLCFSGVSIAQEDENNSPNPLSDFSRLIGGEWHMDDSYTIFEWGVGQMSVKSEAYFITEGKSKLVSEGIWIWHPGEKQLKGYFTAIDMPFVFFDYTTNFQGDKMENDVISYSSGGIGQNFSETWEFTDHDHIIWTLYAINDEDKTKIMGGIYERTRKIGRD
jgi:hypothetical protein